jgi:hypothetical protein
MITQTELKSQLHYDQDTGIFTRIKPKPGFKINSEAGSIDKDGYVVIGINKKVYKAHRLAWLYIYGKFPNKILDHINGNSADNRICNLREANVAENQWNSKLSIKNTSGIKGVSFHKQRKKWQATIKVNGITKYLGIFETKEQAAMIVMEARNKYHKQFVNHGELK